MSDEKDIALRVPLGELGGYLGRQVILLVLRFPVAPILAQRVLQCPIGNDAPPLAGADFYFGDEQEIPALGVRFEEVLEALSQGAFVARAAVADYLFDLRAILLNEPN